VDSLTRAPDSRKSGLKLAAGGVAAAVLVWAAGGMLERSRFGDSDAESVLRIENELRERFDRAAVTLATIAGRAADLRDLIPVSSRDPTAVRELFDALVPLLPEEGSRTTGITVYAHPGGAPLAWTGRVSDLPRDRIEGGATLFFAPRGRLIRVDPVIGRERSIRTGTVVVEQMFAEERRGAPGPGVNDTLILETSLAPVSLRPGLARVATTSPYNFLIPASSGQVLLEAEVRPEDLAAARTYWRQRVRSVVWSVLAITLVLCGGVLMDVRRRARTPREGLTATTAVLALLAAARAASGFAAAPFPRSESLELVVTGLLLAFAVWLLLDTVDRRRVAKPRPRLVGSSAATHALTATLYVVAGAAGGWILWLYLEFLRALVTRSTLDLTHFSLHPVLPGRLALAFGLVLLHVAVVWFAVLLLRAVGVMWRRARSLSLAATAGIFWALGMVAALAIANRLAGDAALPFAPFLVAAAAAAILASALARPRGRARRASQTSRLFALYLALLVPAAAMYPALHRFAVEAKERLIAEDFGPQAVSQREDLWRRRVPETLDQVDAMSSLLEVVTSADEDVRDSAFIVWSQTALAQYRLTSAIELYASNGRLVSSFALNLPEYTATPYLAGNCDDWDLYEEVPLFASSGRHVLRASRGICDGRKPVGGIVVRVMFDYRDLPFISAQQRYLDSLSLDRPAPVEDDLGRDIEFAVYGWSRAPLYTSRTRVWPLPEHVFTRLTASRDSFWETIDRDGEQFRVYYLSDRLGIYALGYPSATPFGHLINLAELITLTFALYILLLAASTVFNAVSSNAPGSGRELLRELRSSFYRKLFLFFVAASVVPVGILALATSTYFSAQLRAGVEEAAVNTATVAQRLVEDYAALQQRGEQALELLDDQIMVLVSRAIDQDVDLFDGPRLQATSERDLFASGVLSERTPSEVYRQIAVARRPTFVDLEEIGGQFYQLAPAPVRAGGREGIVTVPQTLRQQDIERQIDDLNRQVVLGLVLFVLLGAAIGYWMAERIADPVNRLTRATRRIARGDLDVRIAATSSDELRRLVEDFNRMADDLKRQRTELERTQRLEAWAEMARQVAHDIKNPLTPIQLSAEHARRVNLDRGRPLSPALDECITSILTQVKLLRQIATEFSSFASSPVARLEPTSVPALIEEVVEPYRVGLADRITIEVQAQPDLPPVAIDRTLLARALTNIIENALYAMPGGGRLTIRTQASTDGKAITTEIVDTGVGMDQEALRRIFEPYFSTKASGTGLGLTIAKRNVELVGGTIAVASVRGEGTTVTMTLRVSS
jgi:signal transduction histidine kinase